MNQVYMSIHWLCKLSLTAGLPCPMSQLKLSLADPALVQRLAAAGGSGR